MDLRNALVVVTGASSGIGAETALGFGRRGAKVLLIARRRAALESVAKRISDAGGGAVVIPTDLATDAGIQDAVRAVRAVGSPDILVNSAGAGSWRFILDTPPAEVRSTMAVPYVAAFDLTRVFVADMLERGRGHVVNVTSAASFMAWPGATAYAAARWALRGFHEALALELRGTPVRVTLAVFAKVQSPYWENNPGSAERIPGAQRMIRVLSAAEAGDHIVRGVLRRQRRVVAPLTLRLVLWSNQLFPGINRALMSATGVHRKFTPRSRP